MFLSRKQCEKLLQSMGSRVEEKLQTIVEGLEEDNRKLEEIDQNVGQLKAAVQKHDMAIEDLLEEWEDKKSEKDGFRKRIQDCEQSENLLLELFETYQEQFWNLKRFTENKDETWSAQMALMEQKLEQCRKLCSISIIEESGTEVNYDLHEVIEVVDTTERGKDRLIAGIINWGYLYKGRVKKKAQVTAYHAINAETAENEKDRTVDSEK